jgi:hypothetical protein
VAAAIAAGSIPVRLRRPLLIATSRLSSRIHCAPPPTAPTTTAEAAPTCAQLDARRQALEQAKRGLDAAKQAVDKQLKGPAADARKRALDRQRHDLDAQEHALDQQRKGCK